MPTTKINSLSTLPRDLIAGMVVFVVALPLCLGVALASNAPMFSGLVAGIVGGIVVGLLSQSQTSVSGPAAGLTAIVAAQLVSLGSFETFLLAVMIAGVFQIGLGLARAGTLSAFFPSSVIKGLLAAIGVILILKQIPHVLGHDKDPEGEMSFSQPDHENTLTEFYAMLGDLHKGAAVIGLLSVALLIAWDKIPRLKKSLVPAPLVVVLLGVGLSWLFKIWFLGWEIEGSHLVQVPVSKTLREFIGFLRLPDFSQWSNPAVYTAGLTIAIVASLETLLNLEAVDKLDPQQRSSPANRELVAQGIGNLLVGLIGGIPVTSVIVRSSVNINAGGQTKLAAIVHGLLLLVSVMFLPVWLNMVPLSCLAAILLVTGLKLASPALVRQMWSEGRYQFLPFVLTVVSIVLTDLLIGIGIGLAISLMFILRSNLRRPLRSIVERHLGGEVLHIELANQVSFLNRAALDQVFNSIPRGGHILLDALNTVYIDPDILSMIREFKEKTAPIRGVQVSMRGFRDKYKLRNEIQYVDYSTRDLQGLLTPAQVLQILQEGNERFRTGKRLTRDLERQLQATALGQHPLAVLLSCIDSRTPSELIFDLGLGDIFSIRIAGNVTSPMVLGSMEYGCAVAGAKLIVVIGHTQCGAVTAAVNLAGSQANAEQATGCQHLEPIIHEIQNSIDLPSCQHLEKWSETERENLVDAVARRSVLHTVERILQQSRTINRLVQEGKIAVVGAIYDVVTGQIDFFTEEAVGVQSAAAS
ncbi:MAG: bifunctional SulP family inorganic anion transporter/carbonic anhydrase [Planctomycetaceae bacterium]